METQEITGITFEENPMKNRWTILPLTSPGDYSPEIAFFGDHGRSSLSLGLMGRSGLPLLDGSFGFIRSLKSPLDLSLSVFLSPSLFLFQMGERRTQEYGRRRKSKKERWMILSLFYALCLNKKEELRREKNKQKEKRVNRDREA
jgi:hypothetical protein